MTAEAAKPATILIARSPTPDATRRLRERVQAALEPPAGHQEVTRDLIDASNRLLRGGAWPRDLADRLGVPRSRWAAWETKGAADYEASVDTPEALLVGMLRRATAAIEACLREDVRELAAAKGHWQAPARQLGWLRPDAYSDKVLEAVSQQLERILAAAKESLGAEHYEALVRALEDARQGG